MRHEQAIRIFADEERLMDSRSTFNYDTAQKDVEETHTDYSRVEKGAPERLANQAESGQLNRVKEKK